MSACEQMGLGYSHPPTDKVRLVPRHAIFIDYTMFITNSTTVSVCLQCWNPIWNVANPDVRDFYIDKVIAPLASSDQIDGVFFDCFNFAYDMPNPWGRNAVNIPNCTHDKGGPGCDALLEGAVDMAVRTAKALNKGGKVPMFSNPASFINGPKPAPIWLNESKLVEGLQGTTWQLNYEFMRAEGLASTVSCSTAAFGWHPPLMINDHFFRLRGYANDRVSWRTCSKSRSSDWQQVFTCTISTRTNLTQRVHWRTQHRTSRPSW